MKFETSEQAFAYYAARIWTYSDTKFRAFRILNCWREKGGCNCGNIDHGAEFASLAALDLSDEFDLVRWGSDRG